MNKAVVILLVVCVVVALFAAITVAQQERATVSPQPWMVGRYQLFQGTFKVEGDGDTPSFVETGIFKIDTQTGKTWLYRDRVSQRGRRTPTWLKIED